MVATWFRLPRLIRWLLLIPILIAVETGAYSALFPGLRHSPHQWWLYLIFLLIPSAFIADVANLSYRDEPPSPFPLTARLLACAVMLCLVSMMGIITSVMGTYSMVPPHWVLPVLVIPRSDNLLIGNSMIVSFDIGIAGAMLGMYDWWLRVSHPLPSTHTVRALPAANHEQQRSRERDDQVRIAIQRFLEGGPLRYQGVLLIWVLLVLLPLITIGILLFMPIEGRRTVFGGILTAVGVALTYALVVLQNRLYRHVN